MKRSGGGVRWGGVVGLLRGCQGGCGPRIEGIVQCTKRYCTILRKLKNVGEGGGGVAIFEPKTLSMYLKKKKKKKKKEKNLTEPGLEPTISGLEIH